MSTHGTKLIGKLLLNSSPVALCTELQLLSVSPFPEPIHAYL